MSNIAIKVEGIWKRYDLHRKGAGTLRDALANAWKQGLGSFSNRESFWALKDVSFEVPHGQVLGIIGRNGAGKSTLLKILSRITPPTKGRVELHGRVASLLEVGTGFHPELTGRENIFLNGAILGMSRAEIRRKFDEIVDFSGVERFLDTPVKHYSSGMYVRLAFAVAAHLEAEVLLIDEVLAVGDVEFQRKCLGKMGDAAKSGKTVLIVSHNMGAISEISKQALVMAEGGLLFSGNVDQAIKTYIHNYQNRKISDAAIEKHKSLHLLSIKVENSDDAFQILSVRQKKITIEITFYLERRFKLAFGVLLYDILGNQLGLFSPGHLFPEEHLLNFDIGKHTVKAVINLPNLNAGSYSISIILHNPDQEGYLYLKQCLIFEHPGFPGETGYLFESPQRGFLTLDGKMSYNQTSTDRMTKH